MSLAFRIPLKFTIEVDMTVPVIYDTGKREESMASAKELIRVELQTMLRKMADNIVEQLNAD